MVSTANAAAQLSASKIITMLCLAAGACCAEGASVCPGGGDEYMCLDHTVGSHEMEKAQGAYKTSSGYEVVFGIGSFGKQESLNMGKCYWLNLDTGTTVIGQVTNYGADIEDKQFDMQMGGGGFGVFNACAGVPDITKNQQDPCDDDNEINGGSDAVDFIPAPALFAGSTQAMWGKRCGGQTARNQCFYLPGWPAQWEFPSDEPARKSLIELCETAFDYHVRKTNPDNGDWNAKITSGNRTKCPPELVAVTKLQREDDENFTNQEVINSLTEEEENEGKIPPRLTSTMDCCASAATNSANTDGANIDFKADFNVLESCTDDGYTRYN